MVLGGALREGQHLEGLSLGVGIGQGIGQGIGRGTRLVRGLGARRGSAEQSLHAAHHSTVSHGTTSLRGYAYAASSARSDSLLDAIDAPAGLRQHPGIMPGCWP